MVEGVYADDSRLGQGEQEAAPRLQTADRRVVVELLLENALVGPQVVAAQYLCVVGAEEEKLVVGRRLVSLRSR